MARLTRSSWIKILFIGLFCLIVCVGLLGCSIGCSTAIYHARNIASLTHKGMSFQEKGDFAISAQDVHSLEIIWLAGEVDIVVVDDSKATNDIGAEPQADSRDNSKQRSDTNDNTPRTPELTVTGKEESVGSLRDSSRMTWQVRNGVLQISYGVDQWGLSSCSNTNSKRLVLTLPRSVADSLDSIDLSAASGNYNIGPVTCNRMKINLASGQVEGKKLVVQNLDFDVASGKIELQGQFSQLVKLHLASGNVDIACTDTCPARTSIDIASGNMNLGLPKDSGFTATVSKMSGSFTINIPGSWNQPNNDRFVCGDGSNLIDVDMASGNVSVHEN